MFYVNIDGKTDEELLFFGFRFVFEDANIKIYEDYHGEEYIVDKNGPKFFMVDDINTALGLGQEVFQIKIN